ncbi:MAG: hypothetical protein M3209_09785 [Acidobacteriota bacterium]|nr:hypothetical protein [Acidobacteriota bacterium]
MKQTAPQAKNLSKRSPQISKLSASSALSVLLWQCKIQQNWEVKQMRNLAKLYEIPTSGITFLPTVISSNINNRKPSVGEAYTH